MQIPLINICIAFFIVNGLKFQVEIETGAAGDRQPGSFQADQVVGRKTKLVGMDGRHPFFEDRHIIRDNAQPRTFDKRDVFRQKPREIVTDRDLPQLPQTRIVDKLLGDICERTVS